jgi:hypothetical protein
MADDARYQELMAKRDGPGLTAEEANELGKLMAAQEGKSYSHGRAPGDPSTEETEDWDAVKDSPDKSVNEDEMRHQVMEAELTEESMNEGGLPPY